MHQHFHFTGKIKLYHGCIRLGIHIHLYIIFIKVYPIFFTHLPYFYCIIVIVAGIVDALWHRIDDNFCLYNS